jgi:hypothetical protein
MLSSFLGVLPILIPPSCALALSCDQSPIPLLCLPLIKPFSLYFIFSHIFLYAYFLFCFLIIQLYSTVCFVVVVFETGSL